ncbi:NAD(P)H-dependent glycerol-3-phosphate dehydrogenase [Celeribacter litoreus]|uniref:NAD(P)H-dependent glycerol-3-phosphate dehydrogenase n=1 Tax=Celeribacter litoreus TaxID=2876714 RepID=UPI001CC9C89E|nr:NAD(P)H-dependent glycerol-3-phosphate dehydrogenase [Celeribacter litoreus]MCA0042174.1 NAD(P)-dependent glycerol-3-phosphate dehydrogenase [Celeribacter litoreus]
MSYISVLGAGAFGTALAMTIARAGQTVTLWARDPEHAATMAQERANSSRLPGFPFPDPLSVTNSLEDALDADIILLATPMQALSDLLSTIEDPLTGKVLVACSKGIDLKTLRGPTGVISAHKPDAIPAVLTGPSFAVDIAKGLPTALTLACADEKRGKEAQYALATPRLRIYLSTDPIGAELGGGLKNVIAIASGACIGAGLGDSARAALMTRGFAEMQRFGIHAGAQPETLTGLSGFGDLVLTCSSELSRNYRFGLSLGRQEEFDPKMTVEGVATSQAVARIAREQNIEMPISLMVAEIGAGDISVLEALDYLLNRPLKKE